MLFSDGHLLFHSPVSIVLESLRENIPSQHMRCNPSDEILRTLITPQGQPIMDSILKKHSQIIMEVTMNLGNLSLDWNDMKTAPFFMHFIFCLTRAVKQFCRDWKNLVFEVIVSFVVGLLIGILFNGLEFVGPQPKSDYRQCPPSLRAICMTPQNDSVNAYASFLVLAVSLIAIMRGLRVFGFEIESRSQLLDVFLGKRFGVVGCGHYHFIEHIDWACDCIPTHEFCHFLWNCLSDHYGWFSTRIHLVLLF